MRKAEMPGPPQEQVLSYERKINEMRVFILSIVIAFMFFSCLSNKQAIREFNMIFPSKEWQEDTLGCMKNRGRYMTDITQNKAVFNSMPEASVLRLFGKPNFTRNLKDYMEWSYITNCCTNDSVGLEGAELFVIRINNSTKQVIDLYSTIP